MKSTETALAALAALCLQAASAAPQKNDFLRPSISFSDGAETFAGPARGNAGGGWVTFKPEGLPKWRGSAGYRSSLWELSRFSGGREQNGKRPKPERVGGADVPISDAMLADARRFLVETREKGGSLIIRLGYTWSDQPGCEPDDFDVILGHITALSKIIADFDDVVVGIEAGIAGPWAEMHSSDYCKAEYMNRILATYCDNLPETISILVRSPGYITKMAGKNTADTLAMLPFGDKYLKRLGMYNDGYLGTWWDYGTWAGDFTRERGCEMLKTFADHPYGGEMAYVNRDWLDKNMKLFQLEHWNIVKDWYEVHLSYLRNIGERGHTIANFLTDDLKFDSEKYKFDGMPSLKEYDGTDMNKFVRDHMGYRFVVRDARLKPSELRQGGKALLGLEVENAGFGKLLLPSRAEILLRQGADVVAIPAAAKSGFSEIPGGAKKRVGLAFAVPKDAKRGKCEMFVRLSAPLKDEEPGAAPRRPIRFANAGMWNEELKANSFGEVEVK